MIVLYPIKPVYVEKILSGEKIFELRKRLPRETLCKVVIYSTAPDSKVVGFAEVKTTHTNTPESLWEKVSDNAGINIKDYEKYFSGCDEAHAIEFDSVSKFVNPFDIDQLGENVAVPQSFCYLKENIFKKISRRKTEKV